MRMASPGESRREELAAMQQSFESHAARQNTVIEEQRDAFSGR